MTPLLELKKVSVTYGNGAVGLKEIDLRLNRGEIVVLAGATGSGKSTLALRLLNVIPHQVKASTSGEFFLDGISTKDLPPHRLAAHVQLVLQNPEAMLFSLTVEDNIQFGLENLAWPRAEILSRTDEMLRFFEIEKLRRRSPLEISGGEQQAASLAGVLSADPSYFILDEPLTYLDLAAKKRLLAHVQKLKKAGKGILILEHRLDLLAGIADRIVILKEGKKALEAPSGEVSPARFKEELGLRADSVFSFPPSPAAGQKKEALRFENINFRVLKDATLRIFQGEWVSLAGPNGSGKSSLAACAAGLEDPDSGEIWINGARGAKMPAAERARQLGLMFQRPEVQLFCSSVAEELEFGAKNIRLPAAEREARVREEAASLELTDLLGRHPATLSRGEMRRLALACLTIMRPPILILDEPSVGQDYAHLEKIGRRLRRLQQDGHTLLTITHDHDFARQLAGRVVEIENGKIKERRARHGTLEPV